MLKINIVFDFFLSSVENTKKWDILEILGNISLGVNMKTRQMNQFSSSTR